MLQKEKCRICSWFTKGGGGWKSNLFHWNSMFAVERGEVQIVALPVVD